MTVLLRNKLLPALFTKLPFVRRNRATFSDCANDIQILRKYQTAIREKQCASSFEDWDEFILACELPENILELSGGSGSVIEMIFYRWRLWDVECLFSEGRPSEAIGIWESPVKQLDLRRLATCEFALPYLKKANERGWHALTPEVREMIKKEEAGISVELDVEALKGRLGSDRDTRQAVQREPRAARPPVSPKLRKGILERDRYCCLFCQQSTGSNRDIQLEVHHLIPVATVKRLSLDESLLTNPINLATTCRSCNRGTSDILSNRDIEFYVSSFTDGSHPNHGLLRWLCEIRGLQALKTDNVAGDAPSNP